MIDLSAFWGSNYYEHPPLTDIALAKAERTIGFRLPDELVSLLRVQNGGYTQTFVHPMLERTTWANDHVPFHELFGVLDPTHPSPMNLAKSQEITREWGLPPSQVLLSGDGHYWITLDYRNGQEPSVAWIDVECGEDKQIAVSFDAFLAGLVPDAASEKSGNGV